MCEHVFVTISPDVYLLGEMIFWKTMMEQYKPCSNCFCKCGYNYFKMTYFTQSTVFSGV